MYYMEKYGKLIQEKNNRQVYLDVTKNRITKIIKYDAFLDMLKIEQKLNLHKDAYKYVKCPKIHRIQHDTEKKLFIVSMEYIEGKQIYKLYYHDIHYVDISPYNFIMKENKDIYIIDFDDAYIQKTNWFLKDFLDGYNNWNPDFA